MTDRGWRWTVALLRRLPAAAMSRAAGWLADRRLPPSWRAPVLGWWARRLGADVDEMDGCWRDYPTLDAWFTRRLRPGVRTWPTDPAVVASPVDGVVGPVGCLDGDVLLQAKGLPYRAARLLGSEADAAAFLGGTYATFYLSPRHYHRVHTPVPGRLERARHLPGRVLPVHPAVVAREPDLLPGNERLVAWLRTAHGLVAVVAIGAMNVARVTAAFDRTLVANRRRCAGERRYEPPRCLRHGDELFLFRLGSTVVVLAAPGAIRWDLETGREVRVGEVVGYAGCS